MDKTKEQPGQVAGPVDVPEGAFVSPDTYRDQRVPRGQSGAERPPVSDSSGNLISRRALLSAALVSACGRKKAARYQGWLFVASGSEKEIAVANLASFRRIASIALPCAPDQLFQAGKRVFALCREAQAIVEVDVENFRFKGESLCPVSRWRFGWRLARRRPWF